VDDGFKREEKQRVCPSCRMQISVLASKCRFCGEEVGKPKEEARKLSIHDLGGESVQHRAPSGSVMEALESFRVEESLNTTRGPQLGGSSLEQDFGGKSDRPASSGSAFKSAIPTRTRKRAVRSRLIAGIAGGIIVVVLVVLAGPRMLAAISSSRADAGIPTYKNRAPEILAGGGPAIEALQAAVEAIGHEDSARNREIAENAVEAVDKEVRGLLAKKPFNIDNLGAASSLAGRAADLYPNPVTKELVDTAQEDNRIYKMFLKGIDRSKSSATFVLNEPGAPQVTVYQSEANGSTVLLGRFEVDKIASGVGSVTLKDTKRGDRRVVFEMGKAPRALN
jgi:hypothetical protein